MRSRPFRGSRSPCRPGDRQRCVVVVGLDDPEADDDFLGFDIGTVGHESILQESAGSLQSVASGHNRRVELLHPCVPGRLQSLHFLRRRLGAALRGFAIDEQKLRHDGSRDGFAFAGGGLPPALCEYNEQAATVRTPVRDKNIDAPDAIRAACVPKSACSLSQCCRGCGLGVVFWMLIWETVIWDMLTRASTPTSRATAVMVTVAVMCSADMNMPKSTRRQPQTTR